VTIRQVTPASGASQLTINWDCGQVVVPAGTILDIPPGGALESAYGLANLTSLSGTVLTDDTQGDDPGQATVNG
jgi:hypothetical protein